ncbi:Uncharacterised protein [Mycobacteroides abscessus subsp. abscessus]|nr:Uncharacterised protein [Mycobacteroides abscessus subsp. abscessus]
MDATSSGLSCRCIAAAESRMDCGREAPGMTMTLSPSESSQARVTCCGLTPWLRATSAIWGNFSPRFLA